MENLSNKFNHYLTVLVHTFTWQTLILSIINFGESIINSQTIMQFFTVACVITALMAITDIFTQKRGSIPVIILTNLLEVFIVVLGLGGFVFKWFEFIWTDLLVVIGIIVIIYFVIFGIFIFKMKMDSDYINKLIKENKNND